MPSCVFYHIIFLRKTTHCSPLPAYGNYIKIIPLHGDNQVDCLQTCFPLSLSPDSILQPSFGSVAEHPWWSFLAPCPLLPSCGFHRSFPSQHPTCCLVTDSRFKQVPSANPRATPPKTISRLKADPDFSYRSREPIFPVSSASL